MAHRQRVALAALLSFAPLLFVGGHSYAAPADVHGAVGFLVNYQRAKSGPTGIYRMNIDGSGVRQILPNGTQTGGIRADGRLQYYWQIVGHGTVIASADPNGKGVRRLSQPSDEDYNVNVSADGRSLSFGQGSSPNDHLTIADANGRHQHVVLNTPGGTAPSFFPGDKRVAYMRGIDSPTCCLMYTIGIDGRGRRAIANGAAGGWPVVSPDGTMVAFMLLRGRTGTELAVQAVAGGTVRHLTAAGTCVTPPNWSPDGQVLFFGKCTRQGNAITFGSDSIAEIAADGTGLQILAAHLNSVAGLTPIPGPPTAAKPPSASARPAQSPASRTSAPPDATAVGTKHDSSRTGPVVAAAVLAALVALASGYGYLRWR